MVKRDIPGSGINPWSWPRSFCGDEDPWGFSWESIEIVEMDGDNY
jgi:hypothetical protein